MKATIVTLVTAVVLAIQTSSAFGQGTLPTTVFGPPVTATTEITLSNLTTPAPTIPVDMDLALDHTQAAKFAWLEFIALVAPNKASPVRGEPGGPFSSVVGGAKSTYPLVWETYQHRSELFPYYANPAKTPPQPWESTPKYVYKKQPQIPSGVDYTLFNNLDETSQIAQNELSFPNPANAAKPFQVLFEAKGNQWEWNYVNNNQPVPNTKSNPANFDPNTMEIKAAWRPVASIDPTQLYRYHVANVLFYEGENTSIPAVARNGQYALIALHIIHKTTNYPSFVFATFEQVDQYENQVTHQKTGVYFNTTYNAYSFAVDPNGFSAAAAAPPTANTFTATINPTRMFDLSSPSAWPNGVLYKPPVGTGFYPEPGTNTLHTPIAVTQPPTTNNDVANVNKQVTSLMSSLGNEFVWQYYQLKGVQAVPTSDETTEDYYLANIVVESSQAGIQLFRGGLDLSTFLPVPTTRNKFDVTDRGQKYSVGGCMGCHGSAQGLGSDFSFILLEGGNGGFSYPDTLNGSGTVEERVAKAKAKRAGYVRGSIRSSR